jgi:hypothetical protein
VHGAITERCPNTYLLELLGQIQLRLDRVRSTMLVYVPRPRWSMMPISSPPISLLQS